MHTASQVRTQYSSQSQPTETQDITSQNINTTHSARLNAYQPGYRLEIIVHRRLLLKPSDKTATTSSQADGSEVPKLIL